MALDPVSLALSGASLVGGFFGRKRKHLDMEYLKQHFGVKEKAARAQELANYLTNSAYGQKLLASAAEQGQGLQTEMNARAAAAGLSGDTGGQSGASDFATSAGAQAQTGLERGVKGSIYQASIDPAAAEVDAERQAYINDLQNGGYQTDSARTWQQVAQAAGGALAAGGPGNTPQAVAPAGTAQLAGVGPSVLARPNSTDIMPAGAGGGGSLFANLNARKLGMRNAITGQGLVRRPRLSNYGFGGAGTGYAASQFGGAG